jgi:putative aminopeptidase FrvX
VAVLPGDFPVDNTIPRTVATHDDTLGARVKEIKGNGRRKFTPLGVPVVICEGQDYLRHPW